MLSPQPLCMKKPASSAKPLGDQPIDANPLFAVMPVADNQPKIAIRREHTTPLTTEFSR